MIALALVGCRPDCEHPLWYWLFPDYGPLVVPDVPIQNAGFPSLAVTTTSVETAEAVTFTVPMIARSDPAGYTFEDTCHRAMSEWALCAQVRGPMMGLTCDDPLPDVDLRLDLVPAVDWPPAQQDWPTLSFSYRVDHPEDDTIDLWDGWRVTIQSARTDY